MPTIWIIFFALLTGCAEVHTTYPDTIILSHELSRGVKPWHAEIEGHTNEPVTLIVCHGQERDGVWMLYADDPNLRIPVREFVASAKAILPGRQLFLIVCNPAGDVLNISDVYYANDRVWMLPGSDERVWKIKGRDGQPSMTITLHGAGSFTDFRQDF